MSQRERLLEAAKRCLEERGFARTSSRDIAAAAEANHAAINYHYGSKDGLLIAALMDTVEAWGDALVRPGEGEPAEDGLRRTVESFPDHRAMIVSALESLAQAERIPEVREATAEAFERHRVQLARDVYGYEGDERTARAIGSIHMALTAGLAEQFLIDPERASTGEEVTLGLRAIFNQMV
jgi:AcrR family transcriptional regulator